MFENPTYPGIPMPDSVQVLYPRYGLYSYCEGTRCESHRRNQFSGGNDHSPTRTNRFISVLFQALQFCSLLVTLIVIVKCVHWVLLPIAWERRRTLDWTSSPSISMKNYPLYSEVSSNSRPNSLLTRFERFYRCTKRRKPSFWWEIPLVVFWLVRYVCQKRCPRLLREILGAVFTKSLDPKLVRLIITQATPHQAPVIHSDSDVRSFYARVNEYWRTEWNHSLQHLVLLSLAGGDR